MTAKAAKQHADADDNPVDSMTWVRSVRDAMYAATSDLSPEDFMAYVHEAAQAVDARAATRPPNSGKISA